MTTTMISKSLEEVWEWKEKCFEESKGMTILGYLNKVHSNADGILEEMGFLKDKGVNKHTGYKENPVAGLHT